MTPFVEVASARRPIGGATGEFILPLTDVLADEADRVGPKAASLAKLARAGLPTPGGFALTAAAYHHQVRHLGIANLVAAYRTADLRQSRLLSIKIRLALYEGEIAAEIAEPLLAAWRDQCRMAPLGAIRSSALVEDREAANFAGQFESFLGVGDETALLTTVRACWAALWTSSARRYMDGHGLSPADTAMGVLIQPLISARASGGGLSETAGGHKLLSATFGLGSAIAQGEVVPDRIILDRDGRLLEMEPGRKEHQAQCVHGLGARPQAVAPSIVCEASLASADIRTLGEILVTAERLYGGPVEIEWALDDGGIKLLQARPLRVEEAPVPDQIWTQHPGISGHPAGVGWGSGRSVVVRCECELGRVGFGDILVTQVAGPSLASVFPRVAGVVTELGGSTSHLASLARERGIPMVLGVPGATRRIPDGSHVAVDGVAGIVRWIN